MELIVWIVCISILTLSFVVFTIPSWADDHYADPDDRLNNIDEDIITARENIKEFNEKITIAQNELDVLEIEAGNSWEAVQDLEAAELKLENAIQDYRDSRRDLINLKVERSNIIGLIKLEEKEGKAERQSNSTITNSTLTKKLGVILSNSCITMIKNNFTTPCPSYSDLLILDNSIPEFSGIFVRDENNFFHRENPGYINSWRLYDFDNTTRIFVDPPKGMNERVKLITIVPNFDNYFNKGDMIQHQQFEFINVTQTGNSTTKAINYSYQNQTQEFGRVIYHDRYIENCKSAVIDAEDWETLLIDTINFLRNNCDPAYTKFDNREVIIDKITEIDIATSPNWQYFKWLEDIKNSCIITRTC